MIRKLFLGLVGFGGLVLVAGLLLPSSYVIERSTVIAADRERIFTYLDHLEKWPQWSPWTPESFPEFSVEYSETPRGVGAVCHWSHPENGDGRLRITHSEPPRHLRYALKFDQQKSEGTFTLTEVPGGVRVTWRLTGDLAEEPFGRYVAYFMDAIAGQPFTEGLAKLKTIAEG